MLQDYIQKVSLYLFILIVVLIQIVGCVPVEEKVYDSVDFSLQDSIVRSIVNFQDSQQADSLFPFLRHENPTYRYTAARAFASFQEPTAVDSLIPLLNDEYKKIKEITAYSLGQLGNKKAQQALLNTFIPQDTSTVNTKLNGTILESIGKVGGRELLNAMGTVKYRKDDNHLLLGQVRGIYRYALRGIFDEETTDRMVSYVADTELPEDVRVIAANYLSRSKTIDLDAYKFRLLKAMDNESNPYIRMKLVDAVTRSGSSEILPSILAQLDTEEDYRVKCNIYRSLSNFKYINVIDRLLEGLKEPNIHVAMSAAKCLYQQGNAGDATIYPSYVNDEMDIRLRAEVLGATLRHLGGSYAGSRFRIKSTLEKEFESNEDAYDRAELITALSEDLSNIQKIRDLGYVDSHPAVRTAAVEGIRNMLDSPNFNKLYRSNNRKTRTKSTYADYLLEAIESGDVGMIASAANILKNESYNFKEVIDSTSQLENAKMELDLPQDTEAYNELVGAIAILKGKKLPSNPIPGFNHPIDWNLVHECNDSIRAVLLTDKGKITMKFFCESSPGSVANFIDLANKNYFDDKNFHRVVPNFVVQGGCNRGDGYGALDYSIRSELNPLYYDTEGMVGMASAGLHTEGTQFFITHSPTPHLDGKYTIFAQVVEGMDVVHRLLVGDKINDVQIVKI